jgi:hypothetical protein
MYILDGQFSCLELLSAQLVLYHLRHLPLTLQARLFLILQKRPSPEQPVSNVIKYKQTPSSL